MLLLLDPTLNYVEKSTDMLKPSLAIRVGCRSVSLVHSGKKAPSSMMRSDHTAHIPISDPSAESIITSGTLCEDF